MKKILKCAISAGAAVSCLLSASHPASATTMEGDGRLAYDFLLNESAKTSDGKSPFKAYFSQKDYDRISKFPSQDAQCRLDGGYTARLNEWMSLKAGKQNYKDNKYKLRISEPSILVAQVANPQPITYFYAHPSVGILVNSMGYGSPELLNSSHWAGGDFSTDPVKTAEQVKQTYVKGLAWTKCDAYMSLESATPDIPVQMKITAYPLSGNTKVKMGETYTKSAAVSQFQIYSVTLAKDSNLTINHSSKNGMTHFFMWNKKYQKMDFLLNDVDNTSVYQWTYQTSSGEWKNKRKSAYLGSRTKFKVKAGTYYFVAEPTKDDTFTFKMSSTPVSSKTSKTSKKTVKKVSVKLNAKKITLKKGKTKTLKLFGTKKKVTWSSSNRKIASVSAKGKVKALKKGTAKITAKTGGKKYTCTVTVK